MEFHPLRDQLVAEMHARPASPIEPPMLVTRIAAHSGQDGARRDHAHMTALCRRLGASVPGEGMRWAALDAGNWQLRWERHSEFSSWTFLRRAGGPTPGRDDALRDVPRDWLEALPGPVLVFATLCITQDIGDRAPPDRRQEAVGTSLLDGAATLFTDLRPDADGQIRYDLEMHRDDPVLTGRLALSLLEIETYRMMALLAFPVAGETAGNVQQMESEAATLLARLDDDLGISEDRALLGELVGLAGRMEALSASTSFRFRASQAYYDIVLGRIASLREAPLPGMQSIGEFLERRLGPAMRTCSSVAARERDLIDRIARAGEMLNTRVELVSQAINADLLASMDRRAFAQLRLQRTVEGLSVAAISYYVVALLSFVFGAVAETRPGFDTALATGLAAPLVVAAVWLVVSRIRRSVTDV